VNETSWLGNDQPVGEIPDIPSIARAYKAVDTVADELRSLRAAFAQLQRENADLKAAWRLSRGENAHARNQGFDEGYAAAREEMGRAS
jgi:hypothetical protein